MRILFVASEAHPLAKTGGLGDVARALPLALANLGADVRLVLPGYPSALAALQHGQVRASLDSTLGVSDGRLIVGRLPGTNLPIWLVDAPSLFAREGGPYCDQQGLEWPDNARRFAYLSHVAAKLGMGLLDTSWKADVVHANDWHTGLLPLLLSRFDGHRPATVFTIHNMAFQGNFPAETLAAIDIPEGRHGIAGLEFYNQVSFLKAGIRYSDRLVTVSPTYAAEVLTPEFGCGMDGLLRERSADLTGILNGVEYDVWDPATDHHLPRRYDRHSLADKAVCKAEFQRELGWAVAPGVPLIGFASRLTHQKMTDTILAALPWMVDHGAQFVLVGEGDAAYEAAFMEAVRRAPGAIAAHIGYEEPIAHRLQAGVDILLAPSRFEPCGLVQLYAMRYGTLPIVRRTGGPADTVIDTNRLSIADRTATGFVFENASLSDLTNTVARALEFHREPLTWRRLQLQAMEQDFGWDDSAAAYMSLYHEITGISEAVERMHEIVNELPAMSVREVVA